MSDAEKASLYLITAHERPLQLLMEVDDLLRTTQPPAGTDTLPGGERRGTQRRSGPRDGIWRGLPFHVLVMTFLWSTGRGRELWWN